MNTPLAFPAARCARDLAAMAAVARVDARRYDRIADRLDCDTAAGKVAQWSRNLRIFAVLCDLARGAV